MNTCGACSRPMMRGSNRPDGVAREQGPAVCTACYQRARRIPKPRAAHVRTIVDCRDCGRPTMQGHSRPDGVARRFRADQCTRCRSRERYVPSGRPIGDTPHDRAPLLKDDGIIDLIAAERAAHGDKTVRLTRAELAQAVHASLARGLTVTQVANVIGCEERTVLRHEHTPRLTVDAMHTSIIAA